MKNIGIVVGNGNPLDQKSISNVLSGRGYHIKEVAEDWPRDVYVAHNDKIVLNDWRVDYRFFGDGGNLQVSDDFVLVSDTVFTDGKLIEEFKRQKSNFKNMKEFVIDKGKKEYGCGVEIVPTDFKSHDPAHPHIDLYVMVLPKSKILVFDNKFGKGANKDFDYNKIAEDKGFKFLEYDSGKDDVWYGLNNLVLEEKGKDVVVLESQSKNLMRLLNKNGVEAVPVDMLQKNFPPGRIHCQTNTFNLKDKNKIAWIF